MTLLSRRILIGLLAAFLIVAALLIGAHDRRAAAALATDGPNWAAARAFAGLPAATDFTPPVAKTVEQLVDFIRATQDSESWISDFPDEFNSIYAERYIGPNPAQADHKIAEFITSEII